MLEVSGIRAGYGIAVALWDVSIRIDAGELVCVVGPNGAGKTTLINAIAGLNRIRAGTIRMEGKDLTAVPPHRICDQGIAIVPEQRRLFGSMTVLENLELGGYRKAVRARREQGIERVVTMFPVLREKLHQPASVLSGGQQQMVAIGRALMAEPRLLLLDEPSLGLSPTLVLDMFEIIRTINAQGMAVLLVEQNVVMALEIATRAYVLEEGRIAAEGTSSDLLARSEIRSAYLGTD